MNEAEHIQFSWFSNEFENMDIEQIYSDLVGVKAYSSQRNNKVTPLQSFLSQANGSNDGLTFLVKIDSNRLDFVIRKLNEGISRPIEPLFDVNMNLKSWIEKVKEPSFCNSIKLTRLALHAKLGDLSEDVCLQTKKFFELCPLDLNIENVSDLDFKINKTKNISNNICLNRLINYKLDKIVGLSISEVMNGNINDIKNLYYINIFLDFNTVPVKYIEVKSIGKIWTELSDEILKFSEHPCVRDLE